MKPLVSLVIPTFQRSEKLHSLLRSIRENDYKEIEIIVVNNGKPLALAEKNVKFFQLENNRGLAAARNLGAMQAKGRYVLFVDDDNLLGKTAIQEMVEILEKKFIVLGVGPATYYAQDKEKEWFISVHIHWASLRPSFSFSHQLRPVWDNCIETENLHNCFMVRKEDGDLVEWFDEKLFLGGTELDFFERLKREKTGILITTLRAQSWHDIPVRAQNLIRSLGFSSEKRVYYFQRNRAVLVSRYATAWEKVLFLFIFYPFFFLAYSVFFIFFRKWEYLQSHVRATIAGYRYFI